MSVVERTKPYSRLSAAEREKWEEMARCAIYPGLEPVEVEKEARVAPLAREMYYAKAEGRS